MRICFVDYICSRCGAFEAEFENTTPDQCPEILACAGSCGGTMSRRPGIPAPVGVMPSNEEIRNKIIGLKPGDVGYTSSGSGAFDRVMESKGLRSTSEAEVLRSEEQMKSQLEQINRAEMESRRNDGDPSSLHAVAEKKRVEDMDALLSAKTRSAGGAGAAERVVKQTQAFQEAQNQGAIKPFEPGTDVRRSWERTAPGLGEALARAEQRGSDSLTHWLDNPG